MSTVERLAQAAHCRADSWVRLYPVLASLHVSLDDGPEALVTALHEAPPACQAEAERVLRAMGRTSWRVERLVGLYAANPRLGFKLVAGISTWWLRFEPSSRLRIHQIERVPPDA
jgi:hypothetical protein